MTLVISPLSRHSEKTLWYHKERVQLEGIFFMAKKG
ncbi:MAG: hypothetical protein K0Q73_2179, partial [Paenibacillus sp.]|nr:hypothetical protein [Paenibacillus sp.]